MANIYESRSEEIHNLLDRASAANGATVVIPDLQRPYVWQPEQVILLVDSLIRGWPFGTLLMWKVAQENLATIPHREFWQIVDRRQDGEGATMIRKDPPASYHMVLDGQQRIQSLLLALGGDGWGFRLDDRDWLEHVSGVRPRGRRPKKPHWSKGTLCFDLPAFLAEYDRIQDVIGIEYRNVLFWAVTDPDKGQSDWKKPDNYRDPLPKTSVPENVGRFIRLSRLWSEVPSNPNLKEKQFREIAANLLKTHQVKPDQVEQLLGPMGELMSTLRDVKLSKITYLELRPYDQDLWTEDEYGDAIVNIFTRLNTAGRTLTREEITFAWLKVGWDDSATGGKTAGECFGALLEQIRGKGLPIEMDDLVRAASFLWVVSYRKGALISDKDLLKGDTVRPMARDLAKSWGVVVESINVVLGKAADHDLRYGQSGQYNSLNALNILWSWAFLSLQWLRQHPQKVQQEDAYRKSLDEALEQFIDRWMICSHWAGRWGGSSSGTVLIGYAKELHGDQVTYASVTDTAAALAVATHRIQSLVDGLVKDAISYAQTQIVDRREHVSRYSTLLWVWHRLDSARWSMSSIPLRAGRQQKCDYEVDHSVAYALWEKMVKALPPKDDDEEQELLQAINNIGNCALLEKTFNISKSDRPLKGFLQEVHEFKKGKIKLADWAQAFGLPDCLLDPATAAVQDIKQAIDQRDGQMRQELTEFVQGARTRKDI